MKLWLQVLFAQGYLWRDRFPEAYADTGMRGRALGSWLVFPITLLALGTINIASGGVPWIGVAMLATGAAWVMWRGTAIMLRRPLEGKREVVISMHWASGLVVFVLLWLLIFGALASGAWILALIVIAFQIDPGSTWLWEIQNNYLLFRDPTNSRWRVDAQPRTGWVSPWTLVATLIQTYVLLPAEILGLRKTSRPVGGRGS